MRINWNFLGKRGGGRVQNKNLLQEEYGYFLELHYTYMHLHVVFLCLLFLHMLDWISENFLCQTSDFLE